MLTYKVPVMTAFLFLLVFSTAAYICSLMFVRVFDNYIPADGGEVVNSDTAPELSDNAAVTSEEEDTSVKTES